LTPIFAHVIMKIHNTLMEIQMKNGALRVVTLLGLVMASMMFMVPDTKPENILNMNVQIMRTQ
jgi:hypothetical protein